MMTTVDLTAKETKLLERLVSSGWIVCPPGYVPIPRTQEEAQAMNLISENYLKNNRQVSRYQGQQLFWLK